MHAWWYADKRDALIARLETEARNNLPRYRRRVALLAALGYAYMAAVLLLTAVLSAATVLLLLWTKLAWLALQLLGAVLVFAAALVRGLWVRFKSPEGVPLDPREHAALARLVEEARASLLAPRVHRMLLTGHLNAGMVQVPRLGVLGWPRNYLLLGLPLLDALTVDEVRAVVAHELGHLSNADGALGGWIYRTRAAWSQLGASLSNKRHVGMAVMRWFFRWYQPYFDAYSFVAARAQERRADAWSASFAGPRAAADALARMRAVELALTNRYWPAIYRLAVASPEPVGRPFTTMVEALDGLMVAREAEASLVLALASATTDSDTHPCLRERLEALGEGPRLPPPARPTASEVLLGPARESLAARLDADWARSVQKSWTDRFESMQRTAKRLARIDAEGGPSNRDPRKALELAYLRQELHGPEAALPFYRAAFDAHPGEAPLRFALARVLLELNREEGLELVRPLFDAPREAVAAAHYLACEYFRRRGEGEEACRHLAMALEN
jgi:Zn-dependent protease with chaperone function